MRIFWKKIVKFASASAEPQTGKALNLLSEMEIASHRNRNRIAPFFSKKIVRIFLAAGHPSYATALRVVPAQ